jgi:hypothetical protein
MPRYRFNWTNFDPEILVALAQQLQIAGEPSEGLRAKYGLRPKEEFVQEAWQSLLSIWLKSDSDARAHLANALRKRGLGQVDLPDDFSYLESCRNTQGLRQEALQVFLRKGEQSSGAIARPDTPVADLEAATHADQASSLGASETPTSFDRDSLLAFAKEAVASLYGIQAENVYTDSDGDILAPCGSAGVFVSVIDDVEFRVFSLVLREPRESDELFKIINDINQDLRIGRMFYTGSAILLAHNLMAKWTTLAELRVVIDVIGDVADFYDHRLQEVLGGELFLRERAQDEISV